MKKTIIAVLAFVVGLVILLCLTWFTPLMASVALVAKVIFTVLATGFVALMAYEMIKTEVELKNIDIAPLIAYIKEGFTLINCLIAVHVIGFCKLISLIN